MSDTKQKCQHTPQPEGYMQWHAWADAMMKAGWRQRRCPQCGLWAIWYGGRKEVPLTGHSVCLNFGVVK